MEHGTGYRPIPAGVRQDLWRHHPLAASSTPIPNDADLTLFRPPIFNQVATGSCTGHGTVGGVTTSLKAAGQAPPELLCPLSTYQLGRCMGRSYDWDGSGAPPKLQDVGLDPDLAMRASSTWGIATCHEMLGVDGPGAAYEAALMARVNDEPKLGELQGAGRFRVVGQHAVTSSGQARLDDVARALAAGCAVGIAVYASDARFQNYEGGIMGPPPDEWPNHWVYIDGYYTDAAVSRIFRMVNSWGENWGARGEFFACSQVVTASDCVEVYSVRKS